MEHTKGFWKLQKMDNGYRILSESGAYIASLMDKEHWVMQTEANATLIVAAPELLEALIHLVKAVPDDGTWDYQAASDKARRLISNIENPQPI